MISTLETSLDIDFKNISEGLTRANSHKPNLHCYQVEINNHIKLKLDHRESKKEKSSFKFS